MKIYCKDCKYLKIIRSVGILGDCVIEGYVCNAPQNCEGSFLKPNDGHIQYPQQINDKNNCPWFVKRFRIFK